MRRILAVVLIVLALIIIVVPQFTNCYYDGRTLTLESGKQVPMKCLWSARAELITGIPLLVLGILMAVTPRKEPTRSLSILAVVLGALTILVPTALIGVCASADMHCNSILKPTVIVAGILTVLAALAVLVLNERKTAQ
jgi:hypothetical protein